MGAIACALQCDQSTVCCSQAHNQLNVDCVFSPCFPLPLHSYLLNHSFLAMANM